jgi:hypothetical protein
MVELRLFDCIRFEPERLLCNVAPDKHRIKDAAMLFNFGHSGKIGRGSRSREGIRTAALDNQRPDREKR